MAITKATASSIAPAAKGDLVAGTATNDAAVLAVGANGTTLVADSAETTGLKWVTPSGGGSNWSLLNSGGTALTGAATITVSGISSKDKILALVTGCSSTQPGAGFSFRINSSTTTSDYNYAGAVITASATPRLIIQGVGIVNTENRFAFALAGNNATIVNSGSMFVTGGNSSGSKSVSVSGGSNGNTGAGFNEGVGYVYQGIFQGTATVSSIDVVCDYGNFDAGTVYVYTSAS
jgi:hypothetical protein